ncbi:MAG TPA: RES family NAD+ phosphorylase [Chryseosolibacter sp.]|nr:RES family NAD+ phosphorylase [Chryseosolibacter sp.]
MTVFRCTLLKWSKDLSGQGAYLHGGRWNSPGLAMIYTAENNVLAAFEVALRIPFEHISREYVMLPIEVPQKEIHQPVLPKNWYKDLKLTRSLGDAFLRGGEHLLMKVPSALISDSFNYLINPAHPDIKHVKVHPPRPILFDKRLLALIPSKTAG